QPGFTAIAEALDDVRIEKVDLLIDGVLVTTAMTPFGEATFELATEDFGAGGVAPWDCGEIPNAITYTFDVYGPDALNLCWTVAQEVAHAFGLEHEFLQKDPMTYLAGDEPKRFRDVDAPCGEFEIFARCECKPTPQNSYRHIVAMFGPGAPTPPELEIKYPVAGKPTQPGFTAIAEALDDVRIEKVDLLIDGVLVTTAMTPFGEGTFELATEDFGAGEHTMEVIATDVQGVTQTASTTFVQGPPCTPSTVCTGKDVCVDGICVPGPDTPGGLGAVCTSDVECLSRRCADGGEQFKHCVDECNLSNANSCPNEFECISAGAEGVCWPTPSAGCCSATTRPEGPMLLALGLGGLLLRRRRAKL
ncbi:MAG TPA: Ig-like domain-containing protein, partial [Kofleriaceae bacterium]